MLSLIMKKPLTFPQFLLIAAIAILLGIASVFLPHYLLIMGIAGAIYVFISWLWPEVALLGIVLFTSTIFDEAAFPSIPIGVGHLIIADVLLFVLFAIIFIRVLTRSTSYLVHTPLDIPLLGFYITAVISTAVGIYMDRTSLSASLGTWRVLNYLLLFFIVTNLVRTERQLRSLYNGFIVLSVFVAVAMIAQYLLGSSVQIIPGRVETLNTAGRLSYGITRVLPPGQSLVMIAFICLVIQMLFDRISSRFLSYVILLGTVGFAVLLTFNRSFWVSIYISLMLVGLLISFRERVKFGALLFGAAFVLAIVLTQFSGIAGGKVERFVNGMTNRLVTLITPETTQERSVEYRTIENDYALAKIPENPIIGLGIGASYRPEDARISSTNTTYIHNGHLWIMLMTGLVGYSFFAWLIIGFLRRGFKKWKHIPDSFQNGFVLAFCSTMVGLLFVLLVNPFIVDNYWNPIIGIMMGMNEVSYRLNFNNNGLERQLE